MTTNRRLIRVSPEAAFAYLSDIPRHGEWAIHPGLRVQQTSPGPVAVGTTYASHGHQVIDLHDELVVTDYQPARRFAFEARGRGAFLHAFTIEPAPEGCYVTKQMQPLRMPFPLGLFRPLTEIGLRKRMAKDLERIASQLQAR